MLKHTDSPIGYYVNCVGLINHCHLTKWILLVKFIIFPLEVCTEIFELLRFASLLDYNMFFLFFWLKLFDSGLKSKNISLPPRKLEPIRLLIKLLKIKFLVILLSSLFERKFQQDTLFSNISFAFETRFIKNHKPEISLKM